MQEIDLVYKTTQYEYDSQREGVIVRENEIVAYASGPRDQGGANVFLIGAFLENPPDRAGIVSIHRTRKYSTLDAQRKAMDKQKNRLVGTERIS